mmetsp:Transcript_12260/g.20922  ORF Transcript_12260/g.20922 Transcript_12260/m.20922 type:complete len:349 (+) Transcript_12260:121-1167(+)
MAFVSCPVHLGGPKHWDAATTNRSLYRRNVCQTSTSSRRPRSTIMVWNKDEPLVTTPRQDLSSNKVLSESNDGAASTVLSLRNEPKSVSRRDLLLKMGAAAILSPLVLSIIPASWNPLQEPYKQMFAKAMFSDMKDYEEAIAERKLDLFTTYIPINQNTITKLSILDFGIGTGPNLKYYPAFSKVLGVDANQYMFPYTEAEASRLGLSLQLVPTNPEQDLVLPLQSNSVNVVVSTLTLCSVRNPARVLQELVRVMKKDGVLIFIEHTVEYENSQKGLMLRAAQNLLNPLQRIAADGCNLNRDTESIIRSNPDLDIDMMERFHMPDAGFISPHIIGAAYKNKKTPALDV